MLKNPFSFDGRIRRLKYWLRNVIYLAGIFSIAIFLMIVGDTRNILLVILGFSSGLFMMAEEAKCCYDRDKSNPVMLIVLPSTMCIT